MPALQRGLGFFALVVFATGLLCTLFFAYRNLKAGPGDPRGAVRIALVMFSVFMAAWV